MHTITFDIVATWHESLARRPIGDRYYAGLAASGFDEQTMELAAQQQVPLNAAPGNAPYAAVLLSVDTNTQIVLGFTLAGTTVELPIPELSLLQLPSAAIAPYVRNAADAGSPVVPVKILLAY